MHSSCDCPKLKTPCNKLQREIQDFSKGTVPHSQLLTLELHRLPLPRELLLPPGCPRTAIHWACSRVPYITPGLGLKTPEFESCCALYIHTSLDTWLCVVQFTCLPKPWLLTAGVMHLYLCMMQNTRHLGRPGRTLIYTQGSNPNELNSNSIRLCATIV